MPQMLRVGTARLGAPLPTLRSLLVVGERIMAADIIAQRTYTLDHEGGAHRRIDIQAGARWRRLQMPVRDQEGWRTAVNGSPRGA